MIRPINLLRTARHALVGLFTVFAVFLAAPRDAHAVYKFCATITPVYLDANVGDDYLNGPVTAAYHFMQVTRNGSTVSGYADLQGCLTTTFSAAGTYVYGVFPRVQRGTGATVSTTTVLEKPGSTLTGIITQYANLAASPGAAVTEARVQLAGTTLDYLFRASVVVEFAASFMQGINYTIYAKVPLAQSPCVGCVAGNEMFLSSEPGKWLNQEKAVIAHEFGHFFQGGLIGFFGQQNVSSSNTYCEHVDESPCSCIWVADSPNSGICGNEQWDRLHCLNSREYMFGAFQEGFAHMFAAVTLNNTTQSGAIFPYYKNLVNPDLGSATPPPVPHQVVPSTRYRWMETQCGVGMPGKGTEMDWLGFLYYVTAQTANKYSFADLQKVITHSTACNGICTDAKKMTYAKMVQGVDGQTAWTAAKKNHFKNNGSVYGVNH